MKQYQLNLRDGSTLAFSADSVEDDGQVTRFLDAQGSAVAAVRSSEIVRTRIPQAE